MEKPTKQATTSLALTAILLITLPMAVYFLNWHWAETRDYSQFDHFLYYLTETGSAPFYAFITALILSITLSMMCKNHHWTVIFLSVFILQLSSQVIKTGLKQTYKEPRPYMSYITKQDIDVEAFYSEKRRVRTLIIRQSLLNDHHTPIWLQHHWEKETGYSFPSGHTAFAACWVFIFAGFLFREKNRYRFSATIIIFSWAYLMLLSRLTLGMHFPIDLIASIIMTYLLSQGFFYLLGRMNINLSKPLYPFK